MSALRLVFAGTPDAAVPSLERLAVSGHEIVAVVTRPDAPLGRKRVLTPSPVAQAAERLGLPVVKAARLDAETTATLTALAPDLGVIVAYGGLVREPLLSMPSHGWINLHFSLLPAWRGAAPVQHSLIAGDAEVGAAVFQLVPELDAGDVFGELREHAGERTAGELLAHLAVVGGELLEGVVDGIGDGNAVARPQVGEPTFAPKLGVEDGRLDPAGPASELLARYRGVTPEPGAWMTVGGGRVKVLEARSADETPGLAPGELRAEKRRVLLGTATGAVELVRVQPAGKGAMNAADWGRGLPAGAAVDPAEG